MSQFTADIQQLYVAYFSRPADPVGLQYWDGLLAAGKQSLDDISKEFAKSNEYQATFAGKDNAAIVNQVYLNLFGREAETDGLNYWKAQLDSGELTVDNVVKVLTASAEGTDLDTVQARNAAASLFTEGVSQTTEMILAYAGNDANAVAREFLTSFVAPYKTQVNLTELQDYWDNTSYTINYRIDPYSIPGEIISTPLPHTLTLTTGVDSFIGINGGDVFLASSTNGQQTLNALDSLDGGAGKDTLKLVSTTGQAVLVPNSVTVKNIETATLDADSTITVNTSTWSGLTRLTSNSTGGINLTAASNTKLTIKENALGSGNIEINGGLNTKLVANGVSTGGISVGASHAASGNVLVETKFSGVAGAISVTGGQEVAVVQTANNAVNTTSSSGAVTINGTSETSHVAALATVARTASASVAGVTANSVTINDVNAGSNQVGKIKNAYIDSYSSVTINDNALNKLSLAHGAGDVTIHNALAGSNNHKLALSLYDVNGGVLRDDGVYSTINLNTFGKASTLANISDSALQTLNISGSRDLSLTSTSGMTALQNVTIKGNASLHASFSGLKALNIDTSASHGNSVLSVDGMSLTFKGGAGADTLSVGGGSNSVSLGRGADTLNINAASANVNTYTTLRDAHKGVTLGFADLGTESFQSTKLTLAATAVFQDYANAAVQAGGNAATNGAFSWFQFGGDTYLVESRHDASAANASFSNGVDVIVKLTGLVDLSTATFNHGQTLVLG